jgi:hypothetical protein
MKTRRRMHAVDWSAIGSGAVLFGIGVAFKDEQARLIGLALLGIGVPRLSELVGFAGIRKPSKGP